MTPEIRKTILRCTALIALSAIAYGQEGGWRRLGDSAAPKDGAPVPEAQASPPPATYGTAPPAMPVDLTIRPGTYLTVRIDQVLSSDRNQPGDAFTATLTKPVVVDGVVVAQAGQTLGGRVTEALKAGRAQGVARLGIELIDIGIVDGQQIPLKTSFVSRVAPTSVGQDAGAVATTTGVGAAIGAIADGGVGAGIGAGAGAAAGLIGVLLTRGRASVIYPESLLTFRVEAPVTISTARGAQAFRYVESQDYQQAQLVPRERPMPRPAPAPYWGPSVWGGYPYPGYWGPAYWGPSIGVIYGRGGYWGRPYYYRGGWRRW